VKNQLLFFGFFVLIVFGRVGWGQSYLGLDGGFEGSATIDNTNTQTTAQANKWSKYSANQSIADETVTVRSGAHSLKVNNTTTTGRRVFSPLISVSSQTTNVTIQYYRRVADAANSQSNQEGVNRSGIEDLQGTYDTPIANTWEKQTYNPNSRTFTDIAGVIMHKQIGIGGDLFIDDMCIYAGAVDNLAPDPATNPLVASGSADGEINVSWTAPGTGTDNGGYLVLRRDGAAPTSTPNVNGIYAVTNIIGDGTVAYIGTATSFTDASLMIGNTYYYVIYTYDKAYNYSSSTSVSSALPLPVELTSFSASAQNKTVSLTWQTATEVNNYGFEIQKSEARSKNTEWLKVGFVNGAGNSNSPKEYSFTDKSAIAGKYLYRLKQLDNDGQYKYSKEVEVGVSAPLDFSLAQNYPNPFNPSTSIQYSVTGSQNVTLKVFNVIGKEVAVLVNEKKEPGTYTVEFSSANLSSGTYFYRLQSGAFIQTKKMVILK
jgi:hypothetical protein